MNTTVRPRRENENGLEDLLKSFLAGEGFGKAGYCFPGISSSSFSATLGEENFEKVGREARPLQGGDPHCLKYPGSLEEQCQVKDE